MTFTLTSAAERFIRMMLRADGKAGSGFRLSVRPGGCSGLSADMSVVAAPRPGEQIVDHGGLKLFLDAESRVLLQGVTVDFRDTPAQTGLVFHDPKPVSCAASFVTLQH